MKKFYFLTLLSLLIFTPILAQNIVTGVVTSSDDQLPVIGVSVAVKGTNRGVLTNVDGRYSISASGNETLVFSFVGMEKQERRVGNQTVINVVLNPTTEMLEEVVVTAMGVKTEKKKLNFAVQTVNADALTEGRQANFINGLLGKVSGINVTNSGGSPNSGSLLIIRGISSINPSQSNAPLYVLDGVAISGGVSDINPNDIDNITILKGAAASALYGQSGANGAVLITTKQGVTGKISTNVNASVQTNQPIRTPAQQTMYGPGALGFYKPEASGGYGGWGPLLQPDETRYDNIKNYFQTGLYQKYDINVSGGSEKVKAYASAYYSRDKGIVVNDYLNKIGILAKGSYDITKKITLSAMANIVNDVSRGAGGVSSAYSWPINDDITNYMEGGKVRYRYISEKLKSASPVSPLFSRYMDYGKNDNLRAIMQGAINYKAFKNFEAIGRVNFETNSYLYDGYAVPRFDDAVILPDPPKADQFGENTDAYAKALAGYNTMYYQSPYFNQSDYANVDKDILGNYAHSNSRSQFVTLMGILTYKINLISDLTLDLLAGGEVKTRTGISSSIAGRDFIVPGIYSLENVREIQGVNDIGVSHTQRRNGGIFDQVTLDYKGLASLSATTRWDWSSTLSQEFSPYFYPSVTAGVLFSELLNVKNKWFNYGKLRGNWAEVGKDTPAPYLFDRKYTQYPTLPDGGYGVDPSKSVASLLRPEMSSSWEIGLETRFFNSKTRFDLAYYSTYVDNQIVTVRVSPASGYILQTRNEGTVENHGMEFLWDQDILSQRDFSWKTSLTFGFNRGKVVKLPDDIVEIQGTQYTDVFPTAYLNGSTTAISGKDYERTEDGKVIVNAEGYPKINPTKSVLIGNREPDFQMGLNNTFYFRGLNLAFLIDGRKGGDIYNATSRGMWSSGQHKDLEFYRGRQVVWDGVVKQPDGSYIKNTTPIVLDSKTITEYYAGVSSNFIEDGSYIRLNYVTIGYDFLSLLKKKTQFTSLKCSLTASNLLLLTKYTGSDPQINANTGSGGTGGMGIDSYPVPPTRGINFSVLATF